MVSSAAQHVPKCLVITVKWCNKTTKCSAWFLFFMQIEKSLNCLFFTLSQLTFSKEFGRDFWLFVQSRHSFRGRWSVGASPSGRRRAPRPTAWRSRFVWRKCKEYHDQTKYIAHGDNDPHVVMHRSCNNLPLITPTPPRCNYAFM